MSSSDHRPAEAAAAKTVVFLSLGDVVRVSRPGLIASHLWLFALPIALAGSRPGAAFWLGALYITVPLGMLIYGWNDFFDADVDARSGRKTDSVLARYFGLRLSPAKRRVLPLYIVALQAPFVLLAALTGRFWALGWLALMAIANGLYNGFGVRLSRVPVLAESTATWIYLNILWLSILVTGLRQPWAIWALAAAVVLCFQIAGAIVDIEADRAVGKRTFAAAVGEKWASWALAAVVASKAALLLVALQAPVAATLNLAVVPLCLARPTVAGGHWSGLAYVYFVIADWICLALIG